MNRGMTLNNDNLNEDTNIFDIKTQESSKIVKKQYKIDQDKTKILLKFDLACLRFVRGAYNDHKKLPKKLPHISKYIHFLYLIRIGLYQLTIVQCRAILY